jgi:hypothetical protein
MPNDCTAPRYSVVYDRMYSLRGVAGIQYTTLNMVNQTKNRAVKRDTMRTKIREEIVYGSGGLPGTSVVNTIIPANATSSNYQFALCPVGLTSAVLSSGAFVNGTAGNIDPPHLRKLFNLAVDFRYYRVLSGKLIWTPSVGSNQTGLIVLSSSRDPGDSSFAAQAAYSSGPNYKTVNLSAVNKEVSIPLDVDSTWKKVSGVLSCPGGTAPFQGTTTGSALVNTNSVSDVCFSSVSVNIINATTSSAQVNYGLLAVEYDVEFKGVIDAAVNG